MDETEVKKKRKGRGRYVFITYVFLLLFLLLSIRLIFYTAVQSEDFINSSYNPRLTRLSTTTKRGSILTSDGKVIAETVKNEDGSETRQYPFGRQYAHVCGFSSNGSLGAEKEYNFELLRCHDFFLKRIYLELSGEKLPGDNLRLTIDSRLQKAAYDGMQGYDGAVIVMEPDTGKVLAMVSQPDFDPNTIAADWDSIVSDPESSVLLNRTTQGLYPPGSTAKIVTALEMIKEGKDQGFSYECRGEDEKEGYTIHCYKSTAHGVEDLVSAFADSCNCSFGEMGLLLDRDSFTSLATRLLFNEKLPTDLWDVQKSTMVVSQNDPEYLVMQTAIGQGKTLVTPVHMLLLSAAVAENGKVIRPYVSDSIENADGGLVKRYKGKTYGAIMTEDEAARLKEMMRAVVTDGTGTGLLTDEYTAYGKTGTAEFTSDKSLTHSWFTGFAEKDGKKLAVSVIMEGAGTSSSHAVPLTKTIFDTYFKSN